MSHLFITHPLNGLLCLSLGIGLGIYLIRRFKISGHLWWIGAATFVLSQVGHLPFNLLVLNPLIEKYSGALPGPLHIPLIALILGLSAGVFEEFTRYAVYRWWIKAARSWSQGLLFGAGHGGLEAILIGGLSLYTFIQLVSLKNVDLSTIVPANYLTLAQEQVSWYWSMPWYDSLLGALERLFTLPVQIALAVLVMQVFTRKNILWLVYAILFHALVDGSAVFLAPKLGVYWTEALIGGFSVISVLIIFFLRKPDPAPAVLIVPQPKISSILPIEENQENLDATRYQD